MPRKPKTKRVHEVHATLSIPRLVRAGSSLDLEIFADEQKLGTLIIGRGSLYWFGRRRSTSKRISWSRFADMMDELAYGG